jgi:hypothetical protein
VAVGHERGVDGALADLLELDERLLVVLAEDLHAAIGGRAAASRAELRRA